MKYSERKISQRILRFKEDLWFFNENRLHNSEKVNASSNKFKMNESRYIPSFVASKSIEKLFSIDDVNIYIFSIFFFIRFLLVEKGGVTSHRLYCDSLTLMLTDKNFPFLNIEISKAIKTIDQRASAKICMQSYSKCPKNKIYLCRPGKIYFILPNFSGPQFYLFTRQGTQQAATIYRYFEVVL